MRTSARTVLQLTLVAAPAGAAPAKLRAQGTTGRITVHVIAEPAPITGRSSRGRRWRGGE